MSASSEGRRDGCSTAEHLKALVAHRAAFLAHPRASAIRRRSPGLGDSLPWVLVHCDGDMAEATGIVVDGDFDGDWDLDGRFLLFTTDWVPQGEFLGVNGWMGRVSELARLPMLPDPFRPPNGTLTKRRKDMMRPESSEFDIYNLMRVAMRLDAALRGDPGLLEPVAGSSVVLSMLPRQIVSLPDRPGSPPALVVAGRTALGAWVLDQPFRALLLPETDPAMIERVDPAAERVCSEGFLPAPVRPPARPDAIALLDEAARASHAWAGHGGGEGVPDVFMEVRFGSDVYRGLLLRGDEEAILNGLEDEACLLLPSGRHVVLDCAQADRVEVIHGIEVMPDRRDAADV